MFHKKLNYVVVAPWLSISKSIKINEVEFIPIKECEDCDLIKQLSFYYETNLKLRDDFVYIKINDKNYLHLQEINFKKITLVFYILMLFESFNFWNRYTFVGFTNINFQIDIIPLDIDLTQHGRDNIRTELFNTRPLHAPCYSISGNNLSRFKFRKVNKNAMNEFEYLFHFFISSLNFGNHTTDSFRISMQIFLIESLFKKNKAVHDFVQDIQFKLKTKNRKRKCNYHDGSSKKYPCKNKHSFIAYVLYEMYTTRHEYVHSGVSKNKTIKYKGKKLELWRCGFVLTQSLLLQWLLDIKMISLSSFDSVFSDNYFDFDHLFDQMVDFSNDYPKAKYSFE